MTNCWFRHDWQKWQEYDWHGTMMITTTNEPIFGTPYAANLIGKPQGIIQHRQKRVCNRCGKVQDELVR